MNGETLVERNVRLAIRCGTLRTVIEQYHVTFAAVGAFLGDPTPESRAELEAALTAALDTLAAAERITA